METAEVLEQKIRDKKSFLKDYEIKLDFGIYPNIKGNREATETIECYLGEEALSHNAGNAGISHFRYQSDIEKEKLPLIVDESENFNYEYFDEEVKQKLFVCYLTHLLIETRVWSLPDFLSIKGIWVDVNVSHQSYKDIPKGKRPAAIIGS